MAILSLERGVKIVSLINTFALTTLTLRQVQFCMMMMMMMIVVVIVFPLLLLPLIFTIIINVIVIVIIVIRAIYARKNRRVLHRTRLK